jgi:hypothetical protein
MHRVDQVGPLKISGSVAAGREQKLKDCGG